MPNSIEHEDFVTSQQASSARRLLDYSFEKLAQKSGVPVSSVCVLTRHSAANFEHNRLMQVLSSKKASGFLHPQSTSAGDLIQVSGQVTFMSATLTQSKTHKLYTIIFPFLLRFYYNPLR